VGAGACGVLGARSWVASTGGTIREPYAAAAAGRLGSTHTQAALAPQVGVGDEQPRTRAACFEAGTRHEPWDPRGVPSLTTTTWHRVWMLPRQQTYAVRRGMFSISYLVVVSVRHHPDTPMVSYLYLAEKLEHPCA
jgi:hypothetical protein